MVHEVCFLNGWYVCSLHFVFFFKQKTAYEIDCDWSSDVCSSDLATAPSSAVSTRDELANALLTSLRSRTLKSFSAPSRSLRRSRSKRSSSACTFSVEAPSRSEERRVGKECRSGGSAAHERKKGTR